MTKLRDGIFELGIVLLIALLVSTLLDYLIIFAAWLGGQK